MNELTREELQSIYIPAPDSHKGQNGRLLIIGGSHLFHAASLWALTVASRIVDLVHYASVPENNEIVQKAKEEFRSGIVIHRADIGDYIEEDDAILIGPGMTRDEETKTLTDTLLKTYPQKQWVVDAGALQMMDVTLIPPGAILTPHHGEFELVIEKVISEQSIANSQQLSAISLEEKIQKFAETFQCIVLHKGREDLVCDGRNGEMRRICGGNAGMTKGGTGDVLSGLIAGLVCKNDPFLAACAGSLFNKQAGDALFETVGPYFNATDLALEIPKTMKRMLEL